MSIDIFFPEGITRILVALSQANARAMTLARRYGADDRFIAIAEAAYQAALDDVAAAFGLHTTIIMEVRNELDVDGGSGHVGIPAPASGDCARV